MMRCLVFSAALVAAVCPWGRLAAALRTELIPETTAVRHGLTRPWFTQIQMDRGRARVRHVVLCEGTLYVQTDRAMVHAIDAETGRTLWARIVGRPDHPSMIPGVHGDLLAIVNGSHLYVCNRYNGDLLYEAQVGGVPGAGPAVSGKRAYVPMVDGMVMAYRVEPPVDPSKELGTENKNPTPEEAAATEEERRENIRLQQEYVPPLSCRSFGRAMVQPLVTRETPDEEIVAWPTDQGHMNIARIDVHREDRLALKYRLETEATIVTRPTYLPPDPKIPDDSGVIFVTSEDGFVYAVLEQNGESLWRFSVGEPIIQPAVVIGEKVYVATQLGGMYCLDAKTGGEDWWAPRVRQFVAASKQRVYAADKLGRVLVLSAKTGARLDVIPTTALPIKLNNAETDRLYLATETGLIQCLRELELTEPIQHGAARRRTADAAPPPIEQKSIEEVQPAAPPPVQQGPIDGGANPFGEGRADPFGGGGVDPFGGGGQNPPGGGNQAEDPFGSGGGNDDDPFS